MLCCTDYWYMNPALVAPMNVMAIVNASILLVPLNVNVKMDLPKIQHPKSLASMLTSVWLTPVTIVKFVKIVMVHMIAVVMMVISVIRSIRSSVLILTNVLLDFTIAVWILSASIALLIFNVRVKLATKWFETDAQDRDRLMVMQSNLRSRIPKLRHKRMFDRRSQLFKSWLL